MKPCPLFTGEDVQSFWALDRISFVRTDIEGSYVGLKGPRSNKIAKYPQAFVVDEGVEISEMKSSANLIYALNDKGKLFLWDRDNSNRLKEEKIEDRSYSGLTCGKGFQMLRLPYICPDKCTAEITTPVEELIVGYPIRLNITLRDSDGVECYGVSYPLRIAMSITTTIPTHSQLSEHCSPPSMPSSLPVLSFKSLSLPSSTSISLISLDSDPSISLSFSCPNAAPETRLTLSLLLNERQLSIPLSFVLRAREVLEVALEEEQEEAQELEDELQKKVRERAQETLKDEIRKRKEEKRKVEEERKARNDARTGGGFDLEKIAKGRVQPLKVFGKIQKPLIPPEEARSTQNSSSGFRNSSRPSSGKKDQFRIATEYSQKLQKMSLSSRENEFPQPTDESFEKKLSSTATELDMRTSKERGFQIKKNRHPIIRPSSKGRVPSKGIKPGISFEEKQPLDPLIEKQRLLELKRRAKGGLLSMKKDSVIDPVMPIASLKGPRKLSRNKIARPLNK